MKLTPDDIRRTMADRSTEELVSILRNHDEDEWLPEVFEIVGALLTERGVSPAEVVALGPEGEDVVEAQEFVTLGNFFSPVEAHAHRLALEQAGVAAWVFDEMVGIGLGARLQVRAEDEGAARAVLEAEPVPASALPIELAEPPCPKCGSGETFQAVAEAESDSPTPRTWQYECESCGHVWDV